ncbi:phosphoadenosine phosphosulfate reductase domain-containing protein [Nocardia suismassiliense]|uniref:phosphoadenosine phosphosulfate reductase domain-containing protein n=1 Tax=Nocardia suismassiliense TaxID=2077092 RepID=UPI000D1E1AD4|nr:phosphoadenosine phosphosulfate reductase family protein [Nocardia suismassiliense]
MSAANPLCQSGFQLPELPTPHPGPALGDYDLILVNTSGGKDSQACLDVVVTRARAAGVEQRVVAVHAVLGEMEWPGVADLAAEHAAHYGIRFLTTARTGADLLTRINERGRFPDAQNRWCTSDFKRGPIRRVMTALVAELREDLDGRQVRLLNVMGMRAQESPARKRLAEFTHDGARTCPCPTCRFRRAGAERLRAARRPVPPHLKPGHGASNSRRHVDTWLPIHGFSPEQVWARIAVAGTRPHPAYAAGMPRLSCTFCVLASRSALVRAAQLHPGLAARYAEVESRIRHRFRHDLSMAQIIAVAQATTGSAPAAIENWAA